MIDNDLQQELFILRDSFLKVIGAMNQSHDMTMVITSALCAVLVIANGAENRDKSLEFIQNFVSDAIAEAKIPSNGIPYMGPPGNA